VLVGLCYKRNSLLKNNIGSIGSLHGCKNIGFSIAIGRQEKSKVKSQNQKLHFNLELSLVSGIRNATKKADRLNAIP
jgi:hypothetical protein